MSAEGCKGNKTQQAGRDNGAVSFSLGHERIPSRRWARGTTNKAGLLEERGRALQAEGAAGASARDGRDLGRLREDPWAGTELAGRDSGGGTRSL